MKKGSVRSLYIKAFLYFLPPNTNQFIQPSNSDCGSSVLITDEHFLYEWLLNADNMVKQGGRNTDTKRGFIIYGLLNKAVKPMMNPGTFQMGFNCFESTSFPIPMGKLVLSKQLTPI